MYKYNLNEILSISTNQLSKLNFGENIPKHKLDDDMYMIAILLKNRKVDFEAKAKPFIDNIFWRQQLINTLRSTNTISDIMYLYYLLNKIGYDIKKLNSWMQLISKRL